MPEQVWPTGQVLESVHATTHIKVSEQVYPILQIACVPVGEHIDVVRIQVLFAV